MKQFSALTPLESRSGFHTKMSWVELKTEYVGIWYNEVYLIQYFYDFYILLSSEKYGLSHCLEQLYRFI